MSFKFVLGNNVIFFICGIYGVIVFMVSLHFYITTLIFTIFRPILKFFNQVEHPHCVYYRPL
jgi:hypothetical protein